MDRYLRRAVLGASIALMCVFGHHWFQLSPAHLLGQAGQGPGETMPGPTIEDPPGPYQGHSYVPAPPADLIVPSQALSTFIVTYNGFPPQAQAAFQAAVDVWASQLQSPVPIRVTASWLVLRAQCAGLGRSGHCASRFSRRRGRRHVVSVCHSQQDVRGRSHSSGRRYHRELQLELQLVTTAPTATLEWVST